MVNYMPYSGSYASGSSYVTGQPDEERDPHIHFARAGQTYAYGDNAWFGTAPSTSTYQSHISSSSSLAGALDEGASKSRPQSAEVWPENEARPMVPLSYVQQETASAQDYMSVDYSRYEDYSRSWDDQAMVVDDYYSSTYATDVGASYTRESEQSYLNGQLVPTGITHLHVPNHMLTQTITPVLPGRLVVASNTLPFMPTRSYTLEGAVTPVEDRGRLRSPNNAASPQAPRSPSAPSASSPDTTTRSPRVSPKAPKTEEEPVDAAVLLAPQPPQTLMTKFSTKPPFRHVPPPKQPREPKPEPDVDAVIAAVDTAGLPTASAIPPKKKPAMACLFCRERKICCGPPTPESTDTRCKQCIKRDQPCTFPTECRRGQHKRTPRKGTVHTLAGATFPGDDGIADIIVHTGEQPLTPIDSVASTSAAGAVQAKATTQKVKAAKRGRKPRAKPLEGISKVLDKPIVSSPTSSSRSTPPL